MTRFAKCENENTFSRVLHTNKARVRKSGLCSRAFATFGSLFLTKQVSVELSMFPGPQTAISFSSWMALLKELLFSELYFSIGIQS